MLDSQPMTISVFLGSWGSEELHRTMLVWLLRDQSGMHFISEYFTVITGFIAHVTNHVVESASNALIPK